jgi:L-lactate dehydrogenase complex protein LldG
MNSTKESFLRRVKSNLPHALIPEASAHHPGPFQEYSYPTNASTDSLIERFTRELGALSGHVHVLADIEELVGTILKILDKHQARRVLAWEGMALERPWLDKALAEAGIDLVRHQLPDDAADRKMRLAELDDIVVGLTGANGALVDSGTLALVSGPGRGRLASLLPPVHIALVARNKLYPSLPAFLKTHPNVTAEGSNLILITGPSRTGDIEMTLTMGVHGPGEIHVIITP